MNIYDQTIDCALKAYKSILSPLLGPRCRYMPTCSEYAAQVLKGHGPVKGSWLAFRRICRCHPFGGWGYDPPPVKPETSRKTAGREDAKRSRRWKCEA
ncbi:membrane protein insertion efficiency factor YidD [Caulobacter sp. NIBR2454]|uniref:membrane protein insertion efficiency factor YidD n=1 Tax=Caulobacter sp. NIBR2454 TaxID=3015996 RepID=UPI0022B71CC7|nr:membrane protein insertion efficiency factor YidD [Caulobacter sp. NIBR2454]